MGTYCVEEIHNTLRQSAETSCTHIILENAVQPKDSEIICWFSSALIDVGNVIRVIQQQYDYIFCISYWASIVSEGMGIQMCMTFVKCYVWVGYLLMLSTTEDLYLQWYMSNCGTLVERYWQRKAEIPLENPS